MAVQLIRMLGLVVPASWGIRASFTKATAAAEDAGTYKVVVTDSKQASLTSVECVTTVTPPLTLSKDLAASMSVILGQH